MWSARVIESLTESKRAGGITFDTAWEIAVAAHPPFARDRGSNVVALFTDETDFDGPDEPLVDFLYRAAWDAWHDKNRVLRGLIGIRELLEPEESADVAVGSGAVSNRVVA